MLVCRPPGCISSLSVAVTKECNKSKVCSSFQVQWSGIHNGRSSTARGRPGNKVGIWEFPPTTTEQANWKWGKTINSPILPSDLLPPVRMLHNLTKHHHQQGPRVQLHEFKCMDDVPHPKSMQPSSRRVCVHTYRKGALQMLFLNCRTRSDFYFLYISA